MIRKINIDVDNYAKLYIPPHKRKTLLLGWLYMLLVPLKIIWEEYVAWRDIAIIEANLDGSTIALGWYLTLRYGLNNIIYITTREESGMPIGAQSTGTYDETPYYVSFGLEATEATHYQAIPLSNGEDTVYGTDDFVVWVNDADMGAANDIKAIVNKYKQAGKKYHLVAY